MPTLVKVATKNELPGLDQAKEFMVGEKTVCIANVGGTISAMDNVCLHRGGPMGQGIIEGGKIVCPWHGWQYDPRSGAAVHNPAARLRVYPIRIEGDDVLLELD